MIDKWKSTDELPMDREMNEKILILSESRISGNTSLHVHTDYWEVFFDKKCFNLDIFDKKKKLSNGLFSYGRLSDRKLKLKDVKGWMYADKFINGGYG